MNLEEKANQYSENYGNDFIHTGISKQSFKVGYRECKSDITEFIRSNPKLTGEQILKHLEELK